MLQHTDSTSPPPEIIRMSQDATFPAGVEQQQPENVVNKTETPPLPTAKKKKKKKECMCGDSATCRGLTAAFTLLEDPRKRFVRIPHFRNTTRSNNKVREAYLKYLLPEHPIEEETPTKYVAAHHFHPVIVLVHPDVPRTLTKQEAERLGLKLEDTMFDEKVLHRVHIVVPNYSLEKSKTDVTNILDQILSESGDEDVEQVSSDEDIVEATVRVKAVQDEIFFADQSEAPPPADMQPLTESGEFMQDAEPFPVKKCKHFDVTQCPEPIFREYEPTSAEVMVADNEPVDSDNQDLFYEDSPESLVIVSISGVEQEEEKAKQDAWSKFARARSVSSLSSQPLPPIDESKAEEEQQDRKPPPMILRAQSEPIFGQSSEPCRRSILKRANTMGASKNPPCKAVGFGTVGIREYPIMPGDNPGGLCGPPLTIDWMHQEEMEAKLDDYEEARPPRRSQVEFSMPATVRQRLLRKSGYSLSEIQRSTKQANIVRNQRRTSAGFGHMYPLSAAKQRVARGLCNKTLKRAQKQREQDYIQSTLRASSEEEESSSLRYLTAEEGASFDEESVMTPLPVASAATASEEATASNKLSTLCCLKP